MSEAKSLTATAVTNLLREQQFAKAVALYEGAGEEVLQTKGAQFTVPCVDVNGADRYAVITITIPKGSRDGEGYDGHAESEAYLAEVARKAQEKAEKDAEKARKAAEKEAKKAEKATA